jgi:uncharacterized protein
LGNRQTKALFQDIQQQGDKGSYPTLARLTQQLRDAVRSRLRAIRVPTFSMAELAVFWGSVQSGFNGFVHNPVIDARQVRCPTLILHGEIDPWTTIAEINQIAEDLQGARLVLFPNTGHRLLVTSDRKRWMESVARFLDAVIP